MRRRLVPILMVACSLLGCWNKAQDQANPLTGPHPLRSTLGVVSPSPKASPSPIASGSLPTPPSGNSPTPTLVPIATDDPQSPLPPGQAAFQLGQEGQNQWGNGPYLIRPRAAMVAGNVGGAIIVAEGDHRPSMEVLDPAKNPNWVLNNAHDTDVNPGAGVGSDGNLRESMAHNAGLMWAAGGVLNNELWTAGGYNGQTGHYDTTGIVETFVYREAEGFALDRTSSGAQRLLDLPVRDAAGAVIGTNLYIAGGYNRDLIAAQNNADDLTPKTLDTLQIVDLAKHAATRSDDDNAKRMPKAVAGAAGVALNGHFYVIGGYTMDAKGAVTTIADVQDYTPDAKGGAGSWVTTGDKNMVVKPLKVALHSMGAVAFGSRIWVAGGIDKDGNVQASLYLFDFNNPNHDWVEMPAMPTARGMLSLVGMQGALWAIGGIGADGQPLRTVEKFYTEVPADAPATGS